MKKVILLFFVFVLSLSAYGQDSILNDGDKCFKRGDYVCAETKYKEVLKSAVGKEKQIAEIKTQRAKRCIEYLKTADVAFSNKNYKIAKDDYLSILDSNPEDSYAKSQIDIIENLSKKAVAATLNLSKNNLSFEATGGNASISIDRNIEDYEIKLLPSWCSVQKFNNYLVIKCNTNPNSSSRNDYFNVVAGNKTVTVKIIQQGAAISKNYYLNVSKTNLVYYYDGADQQINVDTNADDYSVTLVPSWFTVTKYDRHIRIWCSYNGSNNSRSDWFKITVGNKEVRVSVTQHGTPPNISKNKLKTGKSNLDSFSSLGIQSGEIAKYGLIYERGGRRTIGFRLSARSSLIPEEDILNGKEEKNKTEIEIGPNIKLFKRIYINLGAGYGYYDKLVNNDYANTSEVEKRGYILATSGLMIRVSRVININGGVSFIDIDKDFYRPEITFGMSFNLKK